ncbi:hypothetical protein ACQ4PT_016440 [Festuca glaucescens]
MSGPLDPTRITTVELTNAEIQKKVKAIASTKMLVDWQWSMRPYDRQNLPPAKFPRQATEDALIWFPPDRTDMDIEDPDSITNAPVPEDEEASTSHDPAEKIKLSALMSQLKEGREKQTAELQHGRDEVARLKKKIEGLKSQHKAEIMQVTESTQAEISKAKKELEDQRARAVAEVEKQLNAEINRHVQMLETTDRINKLQKEQADITIEKMEGWKKMAEMLNRDMETAFPESRDLAVNAAVEARKDKMGPHEEYWTLEDHMIAMAARVDHMKVLGIDLPLTAIKVFRTLWPDKTQLKKMKELCAWLNASDVWLIQWRESAGRAGAGTALAFTSSWYEDIEFDVLTTMRVNSKVLDDPEIKKKRQKRAYIMAQYAPVHQFIEDPLQPQDSEGEGDNEEYGDDEDSEEEYADELDAEEPPCKKPRSTEPTLEMSASKTSTPDESTSKTATPGSDIAQTPFLQNSNC